LGSPSGATQQSPNVGGGVDSSNLIRQVLGGMDLRGLSPEDVYKLMGAGLQNKQLDNIDQYYKGQQAQSNEVLKQKAAQDIQENRLKSVEEQRKWLNMKLESGEVKADSPVQVGDRWVQRYHDKYGNLVRQADIGAAPTKDFKAQDKKLLRDPKGNIYWVGPGDPVEPGSVLVTSKDDGYSITDQYTLSALKSGVESGVDAKGEELDEVTRDNNMTLVNANDKHDQYIKIPGKTIPGGGFGGWVDKDVPTQYIKIPKQVSKIVNLPDDKVVYYDEKTEKVLTVGAIKQMAKDKGYTIEEFLKIAGIAK